MLPAQQWYFCGDACFLFRLDLLGASDPLLSEELIQELWHQEATLVSGLEAEQDPKEQLQVSKSGRQSSQLIPPTVMFRASQCLRNIPSTLQAPYIFNRPFLSFFFFFQLSHIQTPKAS